MENKAYSLRSLTADDLFLVLRIINKIGIRDVKKCFESDEVKQAIASVAKDDKVEDVSAVGISVVLEIAGLIMSHLPDCKTEIYQLLETLSGMSAKEIAVLSPVTFYDMIVDVVKAEEFKDFFQRVTASFK